MTRLPSQSDIESKQLLGDIQEILHEVRDGVEEIKNVASISRTDISNINTRLDRMERSLCNTDEASHETCKHLDRNQAFLDISAIQFQGIVRAIFAPFEDLGILYKRRNLQAMETIGCIEHSE